jgi:tRNA (cmo5U34)-methyltransferase
MNNEYASPEGMGEFFDARVEGYDDHMRESVLSFETYYKTIAAPIAQTSSPVRILDLGCGTGLEIPALLEQAPNAEVVGIDLSRRMLDHLMVKGFSPTDNLLLIQGSYLALPLQESSFDYVVAVMTIHHLLPGPKRRLYTNIRRLLRPGGLYIEGDYVVTPEKEKDLLRRYRRSVADIKDVKSGSYHIDIPFSLATQRELFTEAGFSDFTLIHTEGETAIYTVRA